MNLKVSLGQSKKGQTYYVDFENQDINLTLLIGSTGTGKSVLGYHIYEQLIQQNNPEDISFVLIDNTHTEFSHWNQQSPFLYCPSITDRDKAFEVLENIANQVDEINSGTKHYFIHIEECNLIGTDSIRHEKVLKQFLAQKDNSKIHITFSTSRPSPEVISDWLLQLTDLKIIFQLANPQDYITVAGNNFAELAPKEVGEKIVILDNKPTLLSASVSADGLIGVERLLTPVNIYLDIDGVLLTYSLSDRGNPTPYSLELLKFITTHFKVYWLTTHCHGGENRAPEHLYPKFPTEAKEYIDKILPTDWDTWKTDAIDFTQNFIWIDDDFYQPEYDQLTKHGCLERLVKIDLQKDPLRLQKVLSALEVISNSRFENIYYAIDSDILEFAKLKTKDTDFRFDETSNQEIYKKEERLSEIGCYVYAGMLFACRNGLYDYRRGIRDSIINLKLKEFNDSKLDELLKDYNIRFQITDLMGEAIHEWRKEVVK